MFLIKTWFILGMITMVTAVNAEQPACSIEPRCEKPTLGCITDDNKVKCECGTPKHDEIFPQQGGEAIIMHDEDLPKKANRNYPNWYRGCAPDGLADEHSNHYYYTYIGPGVAPPAIQSEKVFCGTFHMKPGKTYPAHNHPAREFYYILEGEAQWYAGDKKITAKPGTFIMHPPYTSHGWTTSDKSWLRAFYCWWMEDEDTPDTLQQGGKMTNPCLTQSPATANLFRIPLPECASENHAEAEKEITIQQDSQMHAE